ncbi:unnamed protein product [Arctogadus glacialis]
MEVLLAGVSISSVPRVGNGSSQRRVTSAVNTEDNRGRRATTRPALQRSGSRGPGPLCGGALDLPVESSPPLGLGGVLIAD